METQTSETKSTNQLLVELLMTRVAVISGVIEDQGKNIFGKDNLLSTEEISDYSLEFLELLVTLLHAGESIDRRSSEHTALRRFFTTTRAQSFFEIMGPEVRAIEAVTYSTRSALVMHPPWVPHTSRDSTS